MLCGLYEVSRHVLQASNNSVDIPVGQQQGVEGFLANCCEKICAPFGIKVEEEEGTFTRYEVGTHKTTDSHGRAPRVCPFS